METETLSIGRGGSGGVGGGNFSTATVNVVLRRRAQFHSLHAFVQTTVVLVVASATFFFDHDDFSDRIMVNAVLLLVVTTISGAVQQVNVNRARLIIFSRSPDF